MDCEQLRTRLDAYVDGELLPGEYEAMQAHAAVCAECARELSAAMRMRGLLSQLPGRVAVPLTTQADWHRAVRKEAARRIRRRRVRFICGIAAALVLVLGATMLLRTMPVRNESNIATIPVGTDEQAVAKGGQADAMPAQAQAGQAEAMQARKQPEQSEAMQAQTRAEQAEVNAVRSDPDAMQTIGKPAADAAIALPTDAVTAGDGEAYEFVTAQGGQAEAIQTQPEQTEVNAVQPGTDAMQASDEPAAGVKIALPTEAVILSDGEAYDFVIARDADEPFTAWKKYGCDDINTADATIEALVEEYSGNVEEYSGKVEQESQPEGSAVYRIELPSEYLDDFLTAVSHVGEELDSETLKTTGDDAIVYIQIDELALYEYDDETAEYEYDAAE